MATSTEILTQALSNYGALLTKVDAKFGDIQSRHASSMRCARSCHSCCKPGLTVSQIESENIKRYLAARPALVERLLQIESANLHNGTRCAFLDADGACGIYEARPIVCRSHGAPLTFKLEADAAPERDVCPLNFEDLNLNEIDPKDLINLDTLNTILALINGQLGGSGARTPLKPSALVHPAGV